MNENGVVVFGWRVTALALAFEMVFPNKEGPASEGAGAGAGAAGCGGAGTAGVAGGCPRYCLISAEVTSLLPASR